jgi:hypothetical protein
MGNSATSSIIGFLLRIKGVRLWALIATVTIAVAVGIVSVMSWLIRGEVSWDYVLTGLVTAAIVAPPSLALLTRMVRQRSRIEELELRHALEVGKAEARASHILRSSADGLYGVDRDGLITFINPAACALLGYCAEQVIGHSAHALFHHSRPDGTPYPVDECPSHGALRSGNAVRVDSEDYWHADGCAVPVMYAAHPMMHAGKIEGAVVSFVDMSEQRAAAAAREEALIAAENLARVRREFLANMSHEIRTPLNGVLGFAQIGRRHCHDADKARNAFEKILASGNLLLGVINEILDFSKIEAGKLTIEHEVVDLDAIIDHSIELIRDRAQGKQLELMVERMPNLPHACMGDALRMGQVLLNLLSNAVKFTAAGTIALAIAQRGSRLVFRVWDTGIGMTPQQIDQLFNPFQQGDGSTTRRYGGTGLGLAISKRLAELMGGDIRVQSEPGKGSTFEFYLPFVSVSVEEAAVATGAASGRVLSAQSLAGISVLVAEDNPLNQAMLSDTLTEVGARVTMVEDGRAAVEAVRNAGQDAFALVLMDVQMPELNGYEATRLIHAFAPDLPIIGQTAHAFGEDREKCLAAGMLAHIAKPFDPDDLVRLVLQYVRTQR